MTLFTPQALALVVRRNAAVVFSGLACGISWVSYILASGPHYYPFGPFVAALIVSGLSGGFSGVRAWVANILRWRMSPVWYAMALLIPLGLMFVASCLNVALGATPHAIDGINSIAGYLWIFPLALVDAPLWEESAWRGYALPLLGAQRSRTASTLLMATLLTIWHLPLAIAAGRVMAPYVIATFASAIVTNWIYYRSGERTVSAIVFHAAQNSASGYLAFRMYSGADLQQLWYLFAATYSIAALLCLRSSSLTR